MLYQMAVVLVVALLTGLVLALIGFLQDKRKLLQRQEYEQYLRNRQTIYYMEKDGIEF